MFPGLCDMNSSLFLQQGPFRSIKEFLDAYENDKNLVKCEAPKWKKDDYDERWSKTSGRVSVREGTQKAHPRTYEPEGRRYKVSTGMWTLHGMD